MQPRRHEFDRRCSTPIRHRREASEGRNWQQLFGLSLSNLQVADKSDDFRYIGVHASEVLTFYLADLPRSTNTAGNGLCRIAYIRR